MEGSKPAPSDSSGEHGRKFYVFAIVSFWLWLFDNISSRRDVILGGRVLHAVCAHVYGHRLA